jgi:hypothetical protein
MNLNLEMHREALLGEWIGVSRERLRQITARQPDARRAGEDLPVLAVKREMPRPRGPGAAGVTIVDWRALR